MSEIKSNSNKNNTARLDQSPQPNYPNFETTKLG